MSDSVTITDKQHSVAEEKNKSNLAQLVNDAVLQVKLDNISA